jgi:hypothetical protein
MAGLEDDGINFPTENKLGRGFRDMDLGMDGKYIKWLLTPTLKKERRK